jgi:uncharacterized membrane protein YsdA (DUF1294 family)
MLVGIVYALMANFALNPLYTFLIASNVATFFLYGYDKFQASRRASRVPEKILWLAVILGGTIGALVGMHTFRHKTQKMSFQMFVALILILQIVALTLILSI